MADTKKTAKIVLDKLGGLYGGAKKISGSLGFILTCAFILHLWDVLNGFRDFGSRLMFYIILMVFAWATIFQKEVGVMDIGNLKIPAILSSIAFLVPYLGNVLPFLNNSEIFQTLIIFFPAWVVYLAFALGSETPYTKIFRWGVIIFWVVLLVPILTTNLAADLHLSNVETGINVQQTISNARRDFSSGVKSIFNNVRKGFNDFVNNIIKIGAGDYYTGKVDEYEDEPVGVYLEDLQAADSKFFEGEKITVWAVLKAKTLDKEININVSCYAKEGDKKIEGGITPQNEFNIATEEEEYLDCTFDKLNPGKMDVTFNAEFNFETMAYLQTYFMDKERLRALVGEGIDVFSHYKISNINPIAIYTNGPVGIGMRTAEPLPVGVYSDKENIPFFFGITIENNWEGTIKKITDLEIQVHDSLELTNCDHEFEFKENEEGYNIYSLVPDKRTEDIKTGKFHSIQCRLNPADPKSLLGNEPITTRYFRVTASYIYELEKSVPVEIEEVKEYISPEEEAMTSEGEAQEFKDKLNEEVDGKTKKEEACKVIIKCSDYDANYYDKLGFNNQIWCDDDPCNLDCYSSFKKSGDEIYYDSCKKCPDEEPIQEEIKDYSVLFDPCDESYLSKDYCEKDKCGLKCKWIDGGCVRDWETYWEIDKGCQYSESEVKDKIKDAAREYDVPESLALGVAFTESSLKHCEGDSVKIGYSNSIGIMQVQVDENNWCSSCSMTKEDLYDINNNIECGVRIFKSKYNTFCDSEGNIKKKNDGTTIFESSVRKNCFNDEYIKKYLTYDNNCEDMAIRYYNGLGCIPESEGGHADIDYVETVRENMKMFS